ncbi:MAG: MBOAT family protein, partial [Clostridia bacterium]|nr:MBOAT family protein [Clostridia bacterium]
RWHISLSTWFREYVYIPLGGNRRGAKRQILNLLIVWGLTGLWHGASYNFLLWGLYYGLILILEKFVFARFLEKFPAFLQHVYTLLIVVFGWGLFYFTDTRALFTFFGNLFDFGSGLIGDKALSLLLRYLPVLLIAALASTPLAKKLYEKARTANWIWLPETVYCAAVLLLSTASLVNQSYNPFLYFRF